MTGKLIGGLTDWRDLADPARRHWHELTRDEQAAAIRRMRAQGMSELVIAAATKLSVEAVNRILAGEGRTRD